MKNNRMIRSVVLLVLLVAVVIGMAYLFNGSLAPKATEYQYTEFIKQVKDGKVDAVYAVQTQLVGRYKDSSIPESAFPDRYDFSASIPSPVFALTYSSFSPAGLSCGSRSLLFRTTR